MRREFARELLTSKRELLSKILAFNRQIQPAGILSEYPQLQPVLSSNYHLRRSLGGTGQFYFDFESIANRLLLLPGEIFPELERHLAACVCSRLLQGGILQHTVRLYKELLGEHCYYFGLNRGRFYLDAALKDKLTAEFDSPEEALSGAGVFCLVLSASQASEFCRSRLQLVREVEVSPRQVFTQAEYHRLNLCIARIITKEIDPSCQSILS